MASHFPSCDTCRHSDHEPFSGPCRGCYMAGAAIRWKQQPLQAIPTHYRGVLYRSRIEARWATFFDAIGLSHDYEAEGYELPGGVRYLPDFWLAQPEWFFEVKGADPSRQDRLKCGLLAAMSQYPVILHAGKIFDPTIEPPDGDPLVPHIEVFDGRPDVVTGRGSDFCGDIDGRGFDCRPPWLWGACTFCEGERAWGCRLMAILTGDYRKLCDAASVDVNEVRAAFRAATSARFEFQPAEV